MERLAADSLLCASPTLRCPFFGRTLVLLADHGEDGSFGLVVNRPLDLALKDVVEDLGLLEATEVRRDIPVMVGGPVEAQTGFVLLEREDGALPPDSTPVGARLAISASTRLLVQVARGEVRGRAMLCLGYAGWSRGQLEGELREGSWIPGAASPARVFAEPAEQRWSGALRGMGIEPGKVTARTVASA